MAGRDLRLPADAPAHHPDEALLLDYASGAADEAVALLIAAHLAWCGACRAQVAELERLGGAMLAAIEPVALAPDALAALLARLDDAAGTAIGGDPGAPLGGTMGQVSEAASRSRRLPTPPGGTALPAPLALALEGRAIDDMPWRQVAPRLERCALPWGRSGIRTVLLRLAPGCRVAAHGHAGRELSLVLNGGFSDEHGRYRPGDVAVVEAGNDHRPVADAGEGCLCVSVNEGPVRPRRGFGRLLGVLRRWRP